MKLRLDWFLSNTIRVEVKGLALVNEVEDPDGGDVFEYCNDATIEASLIDSDGVEVPGETWPITLSYETGSNGNYSGVASSGIVVEDGDELTLQITVTSGSSQGYWEVPIQAKTRTHRQGYGL